MQTNRPERAKAQSLFCFCPFRAISYVPMTYGVAVGYLLLAFQAVYRIQADIHFSNDGHYKNDIAKHCILM